MDYYADGTRRSAMWKRGHETMDYTGTYNGHEHILLVSMVTYISPLSYATYPGK